MNHGSCLFTAFVLGGCLLFASNLAAQVEPPVRSGPGNRAVLSDRGSGSFYDSRGSFSGRSQASGQTTRLYDQRGSYAGRVQSSGDDKSALYDARGSYAGRAETSGGSTRYYDSRGSFAGRSNSSGNTTRFYDGKGAFSGRAETSGNT
ncbi:MAG: hypothetical protein LW697_13885, partial [Blastopirellula sp.]|nr:hypothetical protein [Blastopirellula sp.]